MSDETTPVATPSQTAGPFFHIGLRPQPCDRAGERIRILVRVTEDGGKPVDDALIELWHTVKTEESATFTRMPTGEDGTCELETVRPARHINVCLFARGLLRQLHTRIYFADDPALESDPVLSLVAEHRRQTLLARPDPETAGRWLFDLRLQEPEETVFFDI